MLCTPASTVSTSEAWPAVTQVPSRSERLSASGPIRATFGASVPERQDAALVLQQHDRLRRQFERQVAVLRGQQMPFVMRRSIGVRMLEEAQVET